MTQKIRVLASFEFDKRPSYCRGIAPHNTRCERSVSKTLCDRLLPLSRSRCAVLQGTCHCVHFIVSTSAEKNRAI